MVKSILRSGLKARRIELQIQTCTTSQQEYTTLIKACYISLTMGCLNCARLYVYVSASCFIMAMLIGKYNRQGDNEELLLESAYLFIC